VEGGRFEERAGLPVLTFPVLEGRGVEAVVTTTAGGVSTGPYESLNLGLHVGDDPDVVVENRRRAARAIGLELDDLVFCNQTHGRMVVRVDEQDRGLGSTSLDDAIQGADALVTTTPGVGLAVLVADCVPIVLHHAAGAVAAVHAGWRGTVARVAEAAVEVLCAATGEGPDGIVAGIGPAIPADRYQVGQEVADAASDCFATDDLDAILTPDPDADAHWRFDLWTANARILAAAGVPPEAVTIARDATGQPVSLAGTTDAGARPGTPTFFSDRAVRPCGRFALLTRLLG
jgi:hypothetical protein